MSELISAAESAFERVRDLPELKSHIDEAPPWREFEDDFDFTVVGRGEELAQKVASIEPEESKFFVLPFDVDSDQCYSLLKKLRALGLDSFPIATRPLGEDVSLIHGSIPEFKE